MDSDFIKTLKSKLSNSAILNIIDSNNFKLSFDKNYTGIVENIIIKFSVYKAELFATGKKVSDKEYWVDLSESILSSDDIVNSTINIMKNSTESDLYDKYINNEVIDLYMKGNKQHIVNETENNLLIIDYFNYLKEQGMKFFASSKNLEEYLQYNKQSVHSKAVKIFDTIKQKFTEISEN